MTPLEAWHIISGCMNELTNIRSIYGKGYSQEEVQAQVICFEALRRMEESEDNMGRMTANEAIEEIKSWTNVLISAGSQCTSKTAEAQEMAIKALEEQGRLIKLPCKIGDFIYKIPSKVNYDLNILSRRSEKNRVYEQRVYSIKIYHNGEYLLTTCEGLDIVISDGYKETWFLSREEAEKALKALGESEG